MTQFIQTYLVTLTRMLHKTTLLNGSPNWDGIDKFEDTGNIDFLWHTNIPTKFHLCHLCINTYVLCYSAIVDSLPHMKGSEQPSQLRSLLKSHQKYTLTECHWPKFLTRFSGDLPTFQTSSGGARRRIQEVSGLHLQRRQCPRLNSR